MAQRRNTWNNCLQRESPTISLTPVHTRCSFHQAVMVHPLNLDLPSDLLSSNSMRVKGCPGTSESRPWETLQTFFFFFCYLENWLPLTEVWQFLQDERLQRERKRSRWPPAISASPAEAIDKWVRSSRAFQQTLCRAKVPPRWTQSLRRTMKNDYLWLF